MSRGSYEGPAIDGTVQYISEAPAWQGEGETVDATDPEPVGEERTTNVPIPDGGSRRDDLGGQTTLDDWGRSP
jgi:hypothetical protein